MNGRTPILVLVAIASFMAIGDRYILSTLYGELMRHYSVHSTVVFSLLFSSFYIGYTIFQIPGGRLAQRYGPSMIAGISLISWSSLFFLLPLTSSFSVALAIAFFFGLSQGPIFPSTIYLLRMLYKDRQYGTVTGVVSAVADLSPAAIPVIALGLYHFSNGISAPIFLFAAIGIALGAFFVTRKIRYNAGTEKGRLSSFLGHRYLIFGLSFLLYDFYYYIFLTWYPYFLNERFSITTGSFEYGALPWILMASGGLLFGVLMDRINRDGLISAISYAIVAISTVGIAFSRSPLPFLLFIISILFFLGPALIASWRLSTRLAGEGGSPLVGGWMNFWGNLGGIIAPVVFATLNDRLGLSRSFLLVSSIPVLGIILWMVMSGWSSSHE